MQRAVEVDHERGAPGRMPRVHSGRLIGRRVGRQLSEFGADPQALGDRSVLGVVVRGVGQEKPVQGGFASAARRRETRRAHRLREFVARRRRGQHVPRSKSGRISRIAASVSSTNAPRSAVLRVRLRHVERRVDDGAAIERIEVRVFDQPGDLDARIVDVHPEVAREGPLQLQQHADHADVADRLDLRAARGRQRRDQPGEVGQRNRRDDRVERPDLAADAQAAHARGGTLPRRRPPPAPRAAARCAAEPSRRAPSASSKTSEPPSM